MRLKLNVPTAQLSHVLRHGVPGFEADTLASMLSLLAADAASTDADASPWNPVTITTAVIASAGFLLAAWNARNLWKKEHPKLKWRASWGEDERDYEFFDGEGVRFELRHRGSTPAHDVRIEFEDSAPVVVKTMEFDDHRSCWLTTGDTLEEAFIVLRRDSGSTILVDADGFLQEKVTKVKVSWSQAPDLSKRKSKTYRYKTPKKA